MQAFADLNARLVTATEPYPFDRQTFDKIHLLKCGVRKNELITEKESSFWRKNRRHAVFRLRNIARHWAMLMEREQPVRLVLMDDPLYFAPLAEILFKRRIPVIAVCHNIESLVASNVSSDHRMDLFKLESDLLAQCSTVMTISREDTILLNNFNDANNAEYFPYYPVEDIRQRQ